MKKRKPYYIIIAALCFVTIINIFLPYLELPDKVQGKPGNVLDLKTTVLESHVVDRLAKENDIKKADMYKVVRDVIRGKDAASIAADLEPDKADVVGVVTAEVDKKIAELEKVKGLDQTDFSFVGLIKMSVSVIKNLEQNIIDSVLLIFCMIFTILSAIFAGIYMLVTRADKGYRLVKIVSLTNLVLAALGLISANAISIGALQVDKFYSKYWGSSFFVVMGLNALIWLIAVIASIHEKTQGFVTWKLLIKQRQLIIMALPFVIYALVFYYGPLAGWIMAFQKFRPAAKDQLWVAWDKFKFLFTNKDFSIVFRNTVAMSLINLIFSTLFAIGFALLLNELVHLRPKKFVQTVSYLPHFLSWVIVTGIVTDVLSGETGIINQILLNTHLIHKSINFFADPKYFWWIVGFAVVWKETGWNSIIYLASITSINPDLYEAAAIDGAGRFKKMVHITLPAIRPTIFILLIINLGNILNSGFEVQYILGNDIIRNVSRVIDIYVLDYSFGAGVDFSIGTAAGIFKSAVAIILIYLANRTAKAAGQERLF